MFALNVLWIKCPINKTIDSDLGIKCLVYKMVSLMSYVMYHIKSDQKGFVCIFMYVYAFNCYIHELFWLISFFVTFSIIKTISHFVRQILGEKLWIPDKEYFMQPC